MNPRLFFAILLAGYCLFVPFCLAQKQAPLPEWTSQYQTVRPSGSLFIVSKQGKMAVLTASGKPLTLFAYDTIYNFREGMAIVGLGQRKVNAFGKVLADFKYGFINEQGQLKIPPKYPHVESFSEGLAYVMPNLREDIWFNKEGQPAIVKQRLGQGSSFQGSMAYITLSRVGFRLPASYPGEPNPSDIRGNYIDHQGRLLIPQQYDTIAPYYPGYLRPVRKGGKWGFLDSLAHPVVALQYDDIDPDSAFFWQGRRRVGQAGRYGFMNTRTGQLLIPLAYEDTKPSHSALVWVKKQQKWGCINQAGQVVVPFVYEDVRPFENGLVAVSQGDKWGLIDAKGTLLAPIQYDDLYPFTEGRAAVKLGNKFGFINEQGQEIIAVVYDGVSAFRDGRARVRRWGLLMVLDGNGNRLVTSLQAATRKWVLLGGSLLILLMFLGWRLKANSGSSGLIKH